MRYSLRELPMEILTQAPKLVEQTYASILSAICEGRLEPGARLNQDELAGQMNVSRQPVGQALSILKTQGFVRDAGRRGLIVAPLEREFFRAIYELREAIDPMAARLAAGRATGAEVAEGRELIAAGRAAVLGDSVPAAIAADQDIHMWLYRVAGNPLMVETMRLYWNHLRRAMVEVLKEPGTRRHVWDEHATIVEAVAAHDPALAAERALKHVGTSLRIADSIPSRIIDSVGR
jgi:DNA-binding GntR family transcriptional regulator